MGERASPDQQPLNAFKSINQHRDEVDKTTWH